MVILLLTLLAPWVCLYWAITAGSASLGLAGLVQVADGLITRRAMDKTFGVPAVYTLAQPLGQAALLALVVGSFYKVLTGQGVTWKGRRYSR
jgi:hypothetical protein